MTVRIRNVTLVLAALLAACGREPEVRSASASGARAPSHEPPVEIRPKTEQLPRCRLPEIVAIASALEAGDAQDASDALTQFGAGAGLDASAQLEVQLFRARARAMLGDGVGAVRAIEEARRNFPDQGKVFATAAEIHSAAGRIESAEDEIRRGLEVAGPTIELERARGVMLISREGGALSGLRHLENARTEDPDLYFLRTPLVEAYRLAGNHALAEQDPETALAHARAGLVLEPDLMDLRVLEADALAGLGAFDEALPLYEGLHADGRELGSTVAMAYQRGATLALLSSDRALAVERYVRAMELGLPEAELGFGTQVLDEEYRRKLDRGVEHYEAGEIALALAAFEDASYARPEQVEARNHLGVVLFKMRDYDGAAHQWSLVLELSREQGIELPEPVHLNLARALHKLGRTEELRTLLEDELARAPDGVWSADTRAMLERLE